MDATAEHTGSTLLHVAAENGSVEVARLLLQLGAEVDKARYPDGETALCLASHNALNFEPPVNGRVGVVTLLLAWGAEVDKEGENIGETPLYTASATGNVEVGRCC